MRRIVYLLGCGKQKRRAGWVGPAEDLYTGALFLKKKSFANLVGAEWWIISAQYGLLDRSTVVEPYDKTISDLSRCDRFLWALGIARGFLFKTCRKQATWIDDPENIVVHLHMGRDYADPVEIALRTAGFSNVLRPVEGLGQGQQMQWYSEDRNIRGGLNSLDYTLLEQ